MNLTDIVDNPFYDHKHNHKLTNLLGTIIRNQNKNSKSLGFKLD